ncbi:AbrB family transcriptional regulator [Oceanicola sp. D3]|uniref:AbrB family transcriptional regulator n=1 Tax=Oceanicola sp. D3 TaxID=2587163 RepID=UPI00111F5B28|nr:AbrB family transcriptional regulator [Oceanicola sp. D3]QDC11352.1 AbrB family transcriptional regulator [Oceanicola sp. D3]
MTSRLTSLRLTAQTLCIGGLGAAVAWAVAMPLAFLAGPAIAVACASLAGMKVAVHPRLRDACFLLIGLTIGGLVTPASLGAIASWPVAFVLLALLTLVTLFVIRKMLCRWFAFGQAEGFLAAAPGHLSMVVALAETLGLPLVRPVLMASFRVLILTLTVPLAARLAGVPIGPGLPSPPLTESWLTIAPQIIAAAALGWGLGKLRLPAPLLIGAMAVGAGAHLSGAAVGNLPGWVSQTVLVVMGSLIGSRFAGITARAILADLAAAMLAVAAATTLAAVFALAAARAAGLPFLDVLIAFSPGGLETMIIVGAAAGADPSFVAAAHVSRLIILALILSAFAIRHGRTPPPPGR